MTHVHAEVAKNIKNVVEDSGTLCIEILRMVILNMRLKNARRYDYARIKMWSCHMRSQQTKLL